MKFGIELENYTYGEDGWFHDGSGVMEKPSPAYENYSNLLKFTQENVLKYHFKQDGNLRKSSKIMLHSYPACQGSCASAHIHRSPATFKRIDNIFKLINIFQFFFKNSPRMSGKNMYLSYRHSTSNWCEMRRLSEPEYEGMGNCRENYALTPNRPGSQKTIEFRFNDFPKSLNQLALYYYINLIVEKVIDSKDVYFEFNQMNLDSNKTLKENKLGMDTFSFTNPDSALMFNSTYEDIITFFSKDIDAMLGKLKVYNFYNSNYTVFSKLIKNMFKKESKAYDDYFSGKIPNDYSWSCYWAKLFKQDIPEKIIK